MSAQIQLDVVVPTDFLRRLKGIDERIESRRDDEDTRELVLDAKLVVGKVASQPALTLVGDTAEGHLAVTVTATSWTRVAIAFDANVAGQYRTITRVF